MATETDRRVIEIILEAQNEMAAGIDAAIAQFTGLGGAARGLSADLGKLSAVGMVLGGTALMGIGAAGMMAMKGMADSGAAFQAQMVQIQNNTTMTDADVAKMRETVLSLGADTGSAFDALGEGFMHAENLTSNAVASMAELKVANESAVATGSDVASTANILANLMHEYGADVSTAATEQERFNEIQSRAAHYMGVMHLAAAEANMTLEQFNQQGGQVFAWAANLHVPMEQASAAFATLTKHGFDPAEAGTQVYNMLEHLVKATPQARAELEKLSSATGVDLVSDFTAAGVSSKGLTGILADLRTAFSRLGMSEADQTAEVMKLVPNIRGGAAMFTLLGTGSKDYASILADLNNKELVNSITQDNYNRTMGTASQQLKVMGQEAGAAGISIGESLGPALIGVNSVLGPVLKGISDFAQAQPGLAAAMMGTASAFVAFSGGALALRGAMLLLAPSIDLVGASLGALGILISPAGLVVLGIAAAAAGLTYLASNFDDAGSSADRFAGSVGQIHPELKKLNDELVACHGSTLALGDAMASCHGAASQYAGDIDGINAAVGRYLGLLPAVKNAPMAVSPPSANDLLAQEAQAQIAANKELYGKGGLGTDLLPDQLTAQLEAQDRAHAKTGSAAASGVTAQRQALDGLTHSMLMTAAAGQDLVAAFAQVNATQQQIDVSTARASADQLQIDRDDLLIQQQQQAVAGYLLEYKTQSAALDLQMLPLLTRQRDIQAEISQIGQDTAHLDRERALLEAQSSALPVSQALANARYAQTAAEHSGNMLAASSAAKQVAALQAVLDPLQHRTDLVQQGIDRQRLSDDLTKNGLEREQLAVQSQLKPLQDKKAAIDDATKAIQDQLTVSTLAFERDKNNAASRLVDEKLWQNALEQTKSQQDMAFASLVTGFQDAMVASGKFTADEAQQSLQRLGYWQKETAALAQLYSMQQAGGATPPAAPPAPSAVPSAVPGFASGGSFVVGGSGGVDSELVMFRATPGEPVSVGTPASRGRGGSSYQITVHVDDGAVRVATDAPDGIGQLVGDTIASALQAMAERAERVSTGAAPLLPGNPIQMSR